MTQQIKLSGPDHELEHIGIVVENLERTADFYSTHFGLEFMIMDHILPADGIAKGDPNPFKMKTAFTQFGPVKLEIIQVTEGESLHTDFLKEKGEGIHHLAFGVPDLDRAIAEAESIGMNSIFQFKRPVTDIAAVLGLDLQSDEEVMIFAYFEKTDTSGVIIEFVQHDLPAKIRQMA